jgi:hypothetical protein
VKEVATPKLPPPPWSPELLRALGVGGAHHLAVGGYLFDGQHPCLVVAGIARQEYLAGDPSSRK